MRRTAALIVGGGPAGSAAAIALCKGGLRPELIERTTGEHDIVCGGFLGWDSLAALQRLGVDAAELGARPIHRLRICAGERMFEADLPKAAAGLSRRRLDAVLLAAAAEAGTTVRRGVSAKAGDEERNIRLDDGEEIVADALLLATGKHELRGLARPLDGYDKALSVGLRTSLIVSPALEKTLSGMIELHLFDGGYAGLLLQEDKTANLCLSVSRHRLGEAGGVDALVEAVLRESPRLHDRVGALLPETWEAVAGVPYGWRTRGTQPGLFRLGDQAAVIASLAGDGIAIALNSGLAAAQTLLQAGPEGAQAYQSGFASRAKRPVGVAEALRYAAERDGPRRLMMGALKLLPGLAPLAARLTRIG